jgi:ABC-type transporter MlaC component
MKQLEAFRRGDFDTAYTFASADIQQQFDRPAFEQMVKGGYPEIAESTFATVVSSALAPDGHAYVAVKVHGANGKDIEAFYELVLESGQWKINGVAAQPDPGVVFLPLPSGERAG